MGFGRIRENTHTENAEINMVPLIDVMLVLLVIFIITAPMVTQSVNLSLPKTEEIVVAESTEPQKPVIIEITNEKEILLNQNSVSIEQLNIALNDMKQSLNNDQFIIQLNIDESIPYETVAKTLIEIKKAGLSKIGFTTTLQE